jgi:Uma2 family endonuclease
LATEPIWSADEFLNWEEQQPERWELIGGTPWRMMAGGTVAHASACRNVLVALSLKLRGSGCEVFGENLKLRVGESVFYPDAFVHCGPKAPADTVLTGATFVVEVISPSTEKHDLRDKRVAYLAEPGLAGYLVVELGPRALRLFTPPAGTVETAVATEAGQAVPVPTLGITLAFEDVFPG